MLRVERNTVVSGDPQETEAVTV
ncbi:protein of unknown function [Methylorubrum extorquens]|uniref:Uncharacterized protein n=1 Tax=Methylorubrum extorquens TaxID=408 RepID=A0A2N9AJD1_METEX|nr:protein of unknown function [Methylorubrum extorquens]